MDEEMEKNIEKYLNKHPRFLEMFVKGVLVTKNKNREEILHLIEREKELNLTQISEKIGLAYKNVLAHIKKLEEAELIITEKQEKKRGREVIVRPNSKLEKIEVDEEIVENIRRNS